MPEPHVTENDRRRYAIYYANADQFIQDTLSAAVINNEDYVPGSVHVPFYEQLIEGNGFKIFDFRRDGDNEDPGPYEEALYQRVIGSANRMLVLIGGLGAGKSTAARYLCATLDKRRIEIAETYHCNCNPCIRKPLLIDCDMDRTWDEDKCENEILMRIRREIYVRVIDEWFMRHGEDPSKLTGQERKVLRRLLISTDIYHFAEPERIEFPAALHSDALELDPEYNLLDFSPRDWNVADLVKKYSRAANALDRAIEHAIANIDIGKSFTALAVGYWIHSHQPSPLSLLVIDNLDQQPTNNIEKIVNDLSALDVRHQQLRLLVPLRPSSIVPNGFTHNFRYMYHYGPNCFQMVHQRLNKYVLSRNRDQLKSTLARRQSTVSMAAEEVRLFLIATYLYALICINGLREGIDDSEDVKPQVEEKEIDLHSLHLPSTAVRQLADTLRAIVGTCGRYAMDQMRRYYRHIYAHSAFLRQVETSGLAMKLAAHIPVPYGQIVSAILGPQDTDTGEGVTGLANLYVPTESRAKTEFPTLAKLRILSFLGRKQRVRVRVVVGILAQFGVPFEIAIAALNYLNDKKRLLLWFSKNWNLKGDEPDLDQYVVISEHGQAYLKDLVGDFEYVWFCAQQVVAARSREEAKGFMERLGEYNRLMTGFGATEWKQMTSRRLSSGSEAVLGGEAIANEMLTLFVVYSSLERALRGATIAVRKRDDEYAREISETIEAIVDIVLTRQSEYEVYYGNNGYRVAYATKIKECKAETENMLEDARFLRIAEKLRALVNTWSAPLTTPGPADDQGVLDSDSPDLEWEKFVDGLSSASLPPAEAHARAILATSLGPLLGRRQTIRRMLRDHFPSYGVIAQQLQELLTGSRVVRDAAEALAAYTAPLLRWIDRETAALTAVDNEMKANAFSIPQIASKDTMDEMKNRANALSIQYVALAQRLGVSRTDHLSVRWSA